MVAFRVCSSCTVVFIMIFLSFFYSGYTVVWIIDVFLIFGSGYTVVCIKWSFFYFFSGFTAVCIMVIFRVFSGYSVVCIMVAFRFVKWLNCCLYIGRISCFRWLYVVCIIVVFRFLKAVLRGCTAVCILVVFSDCFTLWLYCNLYNGRVSFFQWLYSCLQIVAFLVFRGYTVVFIVLIFRLFNGFIYNVIRRQQLLYG